jgi:AAA15 family ATPase/GTPase
MLIDFTVENFRSIREPVTLSLIAQGGGERTSKTGRKKADNEIATPFYIRDGKIGLLPVISMFGANASGKSNVVRALNEVLFLISVGANEALITPLASLHPFRLDAEYEKAPSRFELRVAAGGNIYTYELTVDQSQIYEEKLSYTPSTSKQLSSRLLFMRSWDKEKGAFFWKNGPDFSTSYKEIQPSLKASEPFLSFLIQRLNVEILYPLANWLITRWFGVTLGWERVDDFMTYNFLCKYQPERKNAVVDILRSFDVGIFDLEFEILNPEEQSGVEQFKVWVYHNINGRTARWLMQEESNGTKHLFSLACKMLKAFYDGALVIVDEFGSNIHPHITEAIIRQFQNRKINSKGAQLIFTSHDTTLQRGQLLRRDQIWFTEKREDGSTNLYPLTDFHPRNDLALDKAYLDGRFGAVPILPSEEDLLQSTLR